MSTTNTSLNGAITQGATLITLTAFTNPLTGGGGIVAPKVMVRVDGEDMLVQNFTAAPTLGVVRGWNGTAAVAHNNLAPVAYGSVTDFVLPYPVPAGQMTSYSVSGAIAIPTTPPGVENFIVITKAGVAAMTLAAPAADQNGLRLNISSMTAQAHTVTATGLLSTGTASVNVATFAAQKGSGVVLEAVNGLWNVISSVGITFS